VRVRHEAQTYFHGVRHTLVDLSLKKKNPKQSHLND